MSDKIKVDPERARLRCIDLFAGAGGFSLAARNAKIEVVVAVEMKKHACSTYRANLITKGETCLYERDILNIDPNEIAATHFSDGNECDIVLGGPPCQGFSVHRINDRGVGDPRNELILRYFEFVKTLRPKVFLMENVPGILWNRHRSFIDEFYQQGRNSGYDVFPPVTIDARDYGVPQRRKRVFILGVRRDIELNISWPPAATHAAASSDPSLLPWEMAKDVFDLALAVDDENAVHMNHSQALIDVFKSTPLNGGSRHQSNRLLACHSEHNGHKDVYGRIDPSVPGPTMTTACINPSKGRFVHPVENHGITVRHAARFQTFPEWYVFKGGLMAAGEQIGNAVPIKLGEVLLNEIRSGLARRKTNS